MADSPTTRSKKLLESEGWRVAIVEKWNHHCKIRQDLWGFADLIAMNPTEGRTCLIQTTSASNFSARKKKVLANPDAHLWITTGNEIFIHGWKKNKSNRWECREERLDADSVE